MSQLPQSRPFPLCPSYLTPHAPAVPPPHPPPCRPQRGWTVTDGKIHFHKAAADDEAGAQHMELINHTLVYAKELERIV